MANSIPDEWSPADNPYAIAVSQSYWALRTLLTLVKDAHTRSGMEQQIYARLVVKPLRDLRQAAKMQKRAIADVGVPAEAIQALADAMSTFDAELPGAKDVRDMMEHFDEYARGEGNLQKSLMKDQALSQAKVARHYWGGGYDSATDTLAEGPFEIKLSTAVDAARKLYRAINTAGQAVDDMRSPTGNG